MKKKLALSVLLISGILFGGCSNNRNTTDTDSTSQEESTIAVSTTRQSSQKSSTKVSSKAVEDSGRGNQANQSVEPNSSVENTQSPSTSQPVQQQTLWNEAKAQKLQAFMATWGNTMGQNYRSYNPTHSVNHAGLAIPSGVLAGDMQPRVNDQLVEVSWSGDGETGSGYKIVAVYSDAETVASSNLHTYLFTIVNGQPVVLVTMQTQGNSENAIHFSETDNQELKNGFQQIVQGE